jgi:hypothetical protein
MCATTFACPGKEAFGTLVTRRTLELIQSTEVSRSNGMATRATRNGLSLDGHDFFSFQLREFVKGKLSGKTKRAVY